MVAGALVGSGALSGGLAGFALGSAWAIAGLPLLGSAAVLGILVAALALDHAPTPVRMDPLGIHRQVPRSWARVLPLPVAAGLYGARLGIGPLTHQQSWLWWAAAVVGACGGPWVGAAVGAGFAVARLALVVTAGAVAGPRMPVRIAALRRAERVVRPAASLALVMVLLLVLTSACSGDAGNRAAVRSAAGNSEPVRITGTDAETGRARDIDVAATIPDAPAGAAGALDRLLPDPGSGFSRLPDDGSGRGPLDLERAARAEPDADAERSLLKTRGFQVGLGRLWRNGAKDTVYAAVYGFATPEGAAAYLEDGAITLTGRGAALYAVEGMAGARGFSLAERPRTGPSITTHGVAFTRGPHFILLFHASPTPGTTPTFITTLAHQTPNSST